MKKLSVNQMNLESTVYVQKLNKVKNNFYMKIQLKLEILIHTWKDTLHLGIYRIKSNKHL